MNTILWIWSEYSSISSNGKRYQRFKPLMFEQMEKAAADDVPAGMNVP